MAGRMLGRGNTAEVLEWEEGKVLKLFYPQYRENALQEYANARLIQKLPLPAVACYGMLEWAGRPGILYERVDGPSLQTQLFRSQDAQACAELLAGVHRQFLCRSLPAGHSYKDRLRGQILRAEGLSSQRRRRVLALLDGLPEGGALCHGDLHFDNVLMDGALPKVIDFMTVCRDDKRLDIARTAWMLDRAAVPEGLPILDDLPRLRRQALEIYLAKMEVQMEMILAPMTVIAAGRLWELRHQSAECAAALAFLEEQGI